MSVLLDAFALIALLADEVAADEVEAIIRRGDAAMTAVNLAEALDVLQRMQGIPRDRLETIVTPLVGERIALIPVNERIARDAADIRARHYHRKRTPVSLADCILLAATLAPDSLASADEALIRVAQAEHIEITRLSR